MIMNRFTISQIGMKLRFHVIIFNKIKKTSIWKNINYRTELRKKNLKPNYFYLFIYLYNNFYFKLILIILRII